MNHDMGRYALENGPDEPRYRYCYACGGAGTVVSVRRSGLRDCVVCGGEGEIPVDYAEDDR